MPTNTVKYSPKMAAVIAFGREKFFSLSVLPKTVENENFN